MISDDGPKSQAEPVARCVFAAFSRALVAALPPNYGIIISRAPSVIGTGCWSENRAPRAPASDAANQRAKNRQVSLNGVDNSLLAAITFRFWKSKCIPKKGQSRHAHRRRERRPQGLSSQKPSTSFRSSRQKPAIPSPIIGHNTPATKPPSACPPASAFIRVHLRLTQLFAGTAPPHLGGSRPSST
jgi:hypothetical protein